MKLPDYELLQLADVCLLVQSLFLNLLWILLLWGWITARRRFPTRTLGGGAPGFFHWGVAGVVWVVTMVVSLRAFEPTFWFLGFAIANGAFLSILNPAFALCFSISMLLVRPWEIMADNDLIAEIPRFSMMFSTAWAIFYYFVVDRFSIRFGKVPILMLLFTVWVFLTTFKTPAPNEARMAFYETMVRSAIIFFLIYHLTRDRFSVWALRITLVTILSCVGVISIIFYFNNYTDGGRIIAFGIFKNTNDIAAVMTMLLPLAAAPFFLRSRGRYEKLIAGIPVLIGLTVLALAQSRGAVLSVVAAAGTYALLKFRTKALGVIAIVAILAGGMAATKVFNRGEGDMEGSSTSRKSFWISGLRMALYNPVMGVGFGQFPENFESYATEITGEFGKRTAHSTWILALAETGVIGLLLFGALFIIGAVIGAHKLYAEDPSWLYTVMSYGMAMSFLSHTYTIFPYLLIAIITVAVNAQACDKKIEAAAA